MHDTVLISSPRIASVIMSTPCVRPVLTRRNAFDGTHDTTMQGSLSPTSKIPSESKVYPIGGPFIDDLVASPNECKRLLVLPEDLSEFELI
jgi:hypothetical protein